MATFPFEAENNDLIGRTPIHDVAAARGTFVQANRHFAKSRDRQIITHRRDADAPRHAARLGIEKGVGSLFTKRLPTPFIFPNGTNGSSSKPATPIHAISAATRLGIDALTPYLQRGQTVALLGSSGVGKSTLVNALLDADAQRTNSVRCGDDHGRHTTTRRELFVLPGGGMIIDTPGMRELQLWSDDGEGLGSSFADIEALSERCRFRDCGHEAEPGCAIRAALEEGALDADRLASYRKLQRELRYAEIRNDQSARLAEQTKWKKIHKAMRKLDKTGKRRFS